MSVKLEATVASSCVQNSQTASTLSMSQPSATKGLTLHQKLEFTKTKLMAKGFTSATRKQLPRCLTVNEKRTGKPVTIAAGEHVHVVQNPKTGDRVILTNRCDIIAIPSRAYSQLDGKSKENSLLLHWIDQKQEPNRVNLQESTEEVLPEHPDAAGEQESAVSCESVLDLSTKTTDRNSNKENGTANQIEDTVSVVSEQKPESAEKGVRLYHDMDAWMDFEQIELSPDGKTLQVTFLE